MIEKLLRKISFEVNKPKYPVYKKPGGYQAWKDRKPPKQPGIGGLLTCGMVIIVLCSLCFVLSGGGAYYAGQRQQQKQQTATAIAETIEAEITPEVTGEMTEEITATATETITPTETSTAPIVTVSSETPTETSTLSEPEGWEMTQTAIALALLPSATNEPATIQPTVIPVRTNTYAGQNDYPPPVRYVYVTQAPVIVVHTSVPVVREVQVQVPVIVTATFTYTPTLTSTPTETITPTASSTPTATPTFTSTAPIATITSESATSEMTADLIESTPEG